MQVTTLLLGALTAAASVSAGPITARSCQVQYPNSLGFPINFNISKTINPPTERPNAIAFTLPPNAPGPCSLVARFPAGYPIQQAGASAINVFAQDGPAPGALVGTITFSSDPNVETVRTINSFACRTTMGFELEIASDEQDGFVAFSEVLGAGLMMEYGC
jgi:hypothetical protein